MLRPRVTRATAQLTALCCARRAGGCAPGRPHGARQSEPRESCTRPCPCWPQRAHRGNGLGLGPLRPLLSTSLLSATSVLPLRDRSVLLLSPCQPSPSPHSPDSSGALGVACERAGQRPCRRRRARARPLPGVSGGPGSVRGPPRGGCPDGPRWERHWARLSSLKPATGRSCLRAWLCRKMKSGFLRSPASSRASRRQNRPSVSGVAVIDVSVLVTPWAGVSASHMGGVGPKRGPSASPVETGHLAGDVLFPRPQGRSL